MHPQIISVCLARAVSKQTVAYSSLSPSNKLKLWSLQVCKEGWGCPCTCATSPILQHQVITSKNIYIWCFFCVCSYTCNECEMNGVTWRTWQHHEELCSCPGSPSCLESALCLFQTDSPSSRRRQAWDKFFKTGKTQVLCWKRKLRFLSESTDETSHLPTCKTEVQASSKHNTDDFPMAGVSMKGQTVAGCTNILYLVEVSRLSEFLLLQRAQGCLCMLWCMWVFLWSSQQPCLTLCCTCALFPLPTLQSDRQVLPRSYLSHWLLSLFPSCLPLDMLSLQHWGY